MNLLSRARIRICLSNPTRVKSSLSFQMYDRAARSLHLTVGCTPDHVGPGTYDHRRKRINEGEEDMIESKRRVLLWNE